MRVSVPGTIPAVDRSGIMQVPTWGIRGGGEKEYEMAHAVDVAAARVRATARGTTGDPAYQAYQILHIACVILPVLAGVDKLALHLVTWSQYLAPAVTNALPIGRSEFLSIVGVGELTTGLWVAFRPGVGAYVVMLWLWASAASLLVSGYVDIAVRDFGLSLAAVVLARLSVRFDR